MTTDTDPTVDPGTQTLAQRLAQHPDVWRVGVRVLSPDAIYVVAAARRDGLLRLARQGPCRHDKRYVIAHGPEMAGAGFVPDLTDDATAGVLLGMVHEWGEAERSRTGRMFRVDACWWPYDRDNRWSVNVRTDDRKQYIDSGDTLGEAAAACLLACWALDGEATKPAPE